jgi:hypothetical protein
MAPKLQMPSKAAKAAVVGNLARLANAPHGSITDDGLESVPAAIPVQVTESDVCAKMVLFSPVFLLLFDLSNRLIFVIGVMTMVSSTPAVNVAIVSVRPFPGRAVVVSVSIIRNDPLLNVLLVPQGYILPL